MCYSAQIEADYKRYVRDYGVTLSIKDFYELFWRRTVDPKVQIPKALEAAFLNPETEAERDIKSLIDTFAAAQEAKFEQELFKQRRRLADAERTLATRATKKAEEDKRISLKKIEWAMGKLGDIHRRDLIDDDSRIFPGSYAPVIVMEDGRRMLKPMRYQCRPGGKPADYDVRFPGTYNARRDNLEGFWRGQFGVSHGVLVAIAFFEHVNKHRAEGRELAPGEKVEDVILEFKPRPVQEMLVACLWSSWRGGADEPELLSFAAITDDPPPEVAAAGHDRCIVPLRRENVDAWLSPDPRKLRDQYALLDDRERPYYAHRWLEAA